MSTSRDLLLSRHLTTPSSFQPRVVIDSCSDVEPSLLGSHVLVPSSLTATMFYSHEGDIPRSTHASRTRLLTTSQFSHRESMASPQSGKTRFTPPRRVTSTDKLQARRKPRL